MRAYAGKDGDPQPSRPPCRRASCLESSDHTLAWCACRDGSGHARETRARAACSRTGHRQQCRRAHPGDADGAVTVDCEVRKENGCSYVEPRVDGDAGCDERRETNQPDRCVTAVFSPRSSAAPAHLCTPGFETSTAESSERDACDCQPSRFRAWRAWRWPVQPVLQSLRRT